MKITLLLLIPAFILNCLAGQVNGQSVTPTKGKEFWLGFMKNYEVEPQWESLDLFIVSDQNTSGNVTVPGQGWSQAFTINANVTTTVTIPNNIAEVFSNQLVEGKGVFIETEDTVAVFAINFNGYTADATKVLPIQTLGTEYRISAYQGLDDFYDYNSEFLVAATSDDTEVEIELSAATMGGDNAGDIITVQLNAGEVYQVRAANYDDDFTGTIVRATDQSGSCRPFAVFSGSDCTNIPYGCFACDHIYEQNFPTETWGMEFYLVPFDFATSYTYKVLANEDNTSVSIDGGAAFVLNAGQYNEYNSIATPLCVIADKGISVTQYMEGVGCAMAGDPAMLILNDANQKIDNITFSTVESSVITSHNLNIIIATADIGVVSLDGTLIDPAEFQAFNACATHSYAVLTLTSGSHTLDASSGGGVTGYVYGTGSAESYAYSVGSFSPVPPIIIDEAICTNDTVILQISGNYYDPYWYNITEPDDTLEIGYNYIIVPPIENGIYIGVGNDYVSGCEEEFYFSVEIPDPPVIVVTQSETQICQYQSVQLFAQAFPETAVYTYSWSPTAGLDDPTIQNPIATPLQTTTYTVTVTTPTGCGTNTADVTIEVEDGFITAFNATPEEALFCQGDEIQMSAETQTLVAGDDFDPGIDASIWDNISNGTASSVCGSVSDNALYFNGGSPRSAATNSLNVVNGGSINFSLKVANGVSPCDNAEPGDNIVLAYSTNGGGIWTNIQTFFESVYPDFTTLTVPIPAGAETANTMFRWSQIGTFANNQDNWVLDNIYIGEINTADFNYTWSPSAGLNADDIFDPIAGPIETTTYYVEMFDSQSGCTYSDSVNVDVGPPFNLSITPDTTLCDVQGIQLFAEPDIDGEFDWLWTPNTNISSVYSATPTVNPSSTTTYSVTVTSEQGCSETGEVEIIVNELLDLVVNVSDQNICAGEEITLEADMVGNPDGVTFEWTPTDWIDDPTSANTTATPYANITYTITATHEESGCELSDEVPIEVLQLFTVTASPQDTAACILDGMEISAVASTNEPLDWEWNPGNLVEDDNLPVTNLTQNLTAQLIVTATNNAGCGAIDTLNVTLIVETTDLGPDLGFCEDETVWLNTNWPDTYSFEWNNLETTSSIGATEGGIYAVEVTSPDGCFSQDEVLLSMYTYPEVNLGPDSALCQGESLQLDAGNSALNINWSTGDTTQFITVTSTGNYIATVDNAYCFTSDEISIVFNPLPTNQLMNDTAICFGFPPYFLVLNAGNNGATYDWNSGESTQTITVDSPDTYSVNVTTPFGCSGLFLVNISEQCDGSIYIPNSFSPNGDGLNEYWMVKGENIEDFHIQIWNRWGEMIFETHDQYRPWLGEKHLDGEYFSENNVYVYQVKYRLRDKHGVLSDKAAAVGHITLVR